MYFFNGIHKIHVNGNKLLIFQFFQQKEHFFINVDLIWKTGVKRIETNLKNGKIFMFRDRLKF